MSNIDLALVKELREKTSISMSQCIKALSESDNNMENAIRLLKEWGTLKGSEKSGNLALEGRVVATVDKSMTVGSLIEINCQTDFLSRSDDFAKLCSNYSWHIINLEFDIRDKESKQKIEDERLALVAKTGENVVIRRWNRLAGDGNKSYIAAYNHPGSKLSVLVEFALSRAITTNDADFQTFADDVAMQVAANNPMCVYENELPSAMLSDQSSIFLAQLKAEGKPEASWSKILPGKMAKWKSEIVLLNQECLKEPKKTIEQKRAEVSKTLGCEIEIKRFVRFSLGETVEKPQEKDLAGDVAALISGGN